MGNTMVNAEILAGYQPVIGLEIHVQLLTRSKMFSTEGFAFGSPPNTHVSAITLAHPGCLPSINRQSVEHTIRIGLALHCHINRHTYFARKNYFYPDLPKGYQLSQDRDPICEEGYLEIRLDNGEYKRIGIERIHLEEDAGKSIHDQNPRLSYLDLNRAGVGLVEVVSRPDLRSPEEAALAMAEMRKIVRYLGISDGNMQEGSLRCDANVSVMRKTATEYGTRVEIKNMNSFTHVSDAVYYEIDRQIELLENGGRIDQQTRTWDVDARCTRLMRDKETADDYRYFPEPDLQPLYIAETELAAIRQELPVLPVERLKKYLSEWEIPEKEAQALVEHKPLSDYFESLAEITGDPRVAGNWILGPVKEYLNSESMAPEDFPLAVERLGRLIRLVQENKVSHGSAKDKLFRELIADPSHDPEALATSLDLMLATDSSGVEEVMDRLMVQHADETARYRSGKKGLIGFFVGHVMREFKGKADPREVNRIVRDKLEN